MKILVCSMAAIMLTGCVFVQTVGFDKEANTVTLQGETWVSKDKFQEEADKYCGKKANLVKMNEVVEGSETKVDNSKYGLTNAQTKPIKKAQYTFKCS
ncbi:hypothetical protein [Fluviispira vulneris]|uniref:hypothetical protein n=1 Tax=Fluviispira vulneris TaxID=2763012 RepID=UPI0016472A33|nr:hypothetical protein [Fluviispira vulneris]